MSWSGRLEAAKQLFRKVPLRCRIEGFIDVPLTAFRVLNARLIESGQSGFSNTPAPITGAYTLTCIIILCHSDLL